jgi:Anti-anti-sigma regulatory factor (antagonist of anti-sigma factor)
MEIRTEIRTEGRVPVAVIYVQGDINTLTFSDLEEVGRNLYEQGSRRMVLDLSQVRYINSAGLRAVHTIYNLLRSNFPEEADEMLRKRIGENVRSRLLKLVGPNQNVRELLTTSGYDVFLEVHENLESAIQSF